MSNAAHQRYILYGEKDDRVTREEIDLIYSNLKGFKMLKTYPEEGRNLYTANNEEAWKKDVTNFLFKIDEKSK